jgi:D-3-phosphoglycerate dehydrogenase
MEVVAYDPYLTGESWVALGLQNMDFHELLAQSDFVSLHVPLTVDTQSLLGAAELAAMKSGTYLVNCARGGLVDEVALVQALQSGQLAGAALDVFEQEPVTESALLKAPNVILTPHVAASTREAQAQVAVDIAAQVVDFFAGRPVAYPINPDVLRPAAV